MTDSATSVSIFVSYARKDRAMFEHLNTHLALIRRKSWLDYWDRQQLLPGDDQKQVIQNHRDRADIILLLISADFFASEECNSDMQEALARLQQGSVQVIPILVNSCLWEKSPIGHLEPRPKNRKPVSRWESKDEAWSLIAEELTAIIENLHIAKLAAFASANAPLPLVLPARRTLPPLFAPEPADTFLASSTSAPTSASSRYHSVFISYSSKDRTFAEKLYYDLEAHGVKCWYDKKDLKIGDKFAYRIEDAIHDYEKLLVVISEPAVSSQWVESEVHAVFDKERKENAWLLLPILINESVKRDLPSLPPWVRDTFRQRHIGDFTGWDTSDAIYNQALTRLLRDLQAD